MILNFKCNVICTNIKIEIVSSFFVNVHYTQTIFGDVGDVKRKRETVE